MDTLIILGGVFHLDFAIFHLFFSRFLDWKRDLAHLTSINRAVVLILNLCLTFVFIAVAYVSFFYPVELLSTNVGKAILVLISIFWFLRFTEQLIFFGLKKPLSVVLTILFAVGCCIYIITVF